MGLSLGARYLSLGAGFLCPRQDCTETILAITLHKISTKVPIAKSQDRLEGTPQTVEHLAQHRNPGQTHGHLYT